MVSVAHEADALMSRPADPDARLADVPAPTLVMKATDSPAPVREVARRLTVDGHRQLHVLDAVVTWRRSPTPTPSLPSCNRSSLVLVHAVADR